VRVGERLSGVRRRLPVRVCDPPRPQARFGAATRSGTRSSATALRSRMRAVAAASTDIRPRRRRAPRPARLARPASRWTGC